MNILGVTVSDTFTFNHHVTALVEKSARPLHVLKTICAHGQVDNALSDVTRAILVAIGCSVKYVLCNVRQ